MSDETLLRTMLAQVAGQGSRIQPFDADDLRLMQIVLSPLSAAPITGESARLFHVDCYRLGGDEDAESIGIEEILGGEDIVMIEWPEQIEAFLPTDRLWIQMDLLDAGGTKRQLTFRASGTHYETLLDAFRRSAFGV